MVTAGDPVASGIVASLARPGGNLTGVTALGEELSGKRLELLKEAVPGVTRVAVLSNPANPDKGSSLKGLEGAARAVGVQLRGLEIRDPTELEQAFAAIRSERARALMVLTDLMLLAHRRRIVELAAKSRLPAMYGLREFVDDGGLMFYGAALPDMYRRAATHVDKILKGAKPADLPVEQPPALNWSSTVRPEKADVFSGSQPRRGKSQSPVTRVAGWRETETLKPTDQAIERMVSESPGRNGSERTGGPERPKPRRPSLTVERRRQHGTSHLADAAGHSGGVIATAR